MRESRAQARVEEAEAGELGPDVQAALDRANHEDPTGRLARYLARTQVPLDLLALVTLWIVLVPAFDVGDAFGLRGFGLQFRLGLSLIYGIDIAIRCRLAQHHLRYLKSHPIGLLVVLAPPVRVLFSLRLIRVLFRRGNLPRFLFAALLLLLNGAIIVYLFERSAPDGNITTLGESIWWSIVTVTTVGYGDYFPVTVQGEVVATFIMVIGIIAVAVLTAQVASSFVDQSNQKPLFGSTARDALEARHADEPVVADGEADDQGGAGSTRPEPEPAAPTPGPEPPSAAPVAAPDLAALDERLTRIEQLLVALQPPAAPTTGGGPTGPTVS